MNPLYKNLMQDEADDEEKPQGPHPRIGEGEGQEQSTSAMQEQSMGTERPTIAEGVDEAVEVPVIFRRSRMRHRRSSGQPPIRQRRI